MNKSFNCAGCDEIRFEDRKILCTGGKMVATAILCLDCIDKYNYGSDVLYDDDEWKIFMMKRKLDGNTSDQKRSVASHTNWCKV